MTDTEESKKRDAAIRKAYSAASKRLREAHMDEFHAMQSEEAAKLGIKWSPRPSAEQKAEEELSSILAKHPSLAERLYNEVEQRLAAKTSGPAPAEPPTGG